MLFTVPKTVLCIALLAATMSCSKSTFTSRSMKERAAAVPTATPVKAALPATKGPDEECTTEISSDSEYTFQSFPEITGFVNSLMVFTPMPGSAHMSSDDVTAKKICELKGYVEMVGKAARGFTSTKDNQIGRWNEEIGDFDLIPAAQSNSFLTVLKCTGTVVLKCPNAK